MSTFKKERKTDSAHILPLKSLQMLKVSLVITACRSYTAPMFSLSFRESGKHLSLHLEDHLFFGTPVAISLSGGAIPYRATTL